MAKRHKRYQNVNKQNYRSSFRSMEKVTFSNKKLLSSASVVPSANKKLQTNPNHSVESAIFGHYNQTIAKVNPIQASFVQK